MSAIEDLISLINRLAHDNAQIAMKAKELLAENERLKAKVKELEDKA